MHDTEALWSTFGAILRSTAPKSRRSECDMARMARRERRIFVEAHMAAGGTTYSTATLQQSSLT